MSAPNTNLEKERRRHRGPLIGMLAVVLFALALMVYWLWDEFSMGTAPGPATAPGEAAQSVGAADSGSVPSEADPLTPADEPSTPAPSAPAD